MSVGTGKAWRRWRNVGAIMGKRFSAEDELRKRFGRSPATAPDPQSKVISSASGNSSRRAESSPVSSNTSKERE